MKNTLRKAGIGSLCLGIASALGATASFLPVAGTTVPPGTDVVFDIVVQVGSLTSFDAADIVIGAPDAGEVLFTYAPEWDQAFLNITGPLNDVGFYPQDVFVGGNNPSTVGTSLRLGTVTLKTSGLAEGTYIVQISNTIDGGVSKLSRGDLRDPLNGSATFTIQCASIDSDCDGDLDLIDYTDMPSCVTGPGQTASSSCLRFDADGDNDVDLSDVQSDFTDFTGSH